MEKADIQQGFENAEWLILQLLANPALAKFPRAEVHLEHAESDNS